MFGRVLNTRILLQLLTFCGVISKEICTIYTIQLGETEKYQKNI